MKSDSDLIRCWLLVQSNKQVFGIKRVGLFQFISPLSVDEIAADENLTTINKGTLSCDLSIPKYASPCLMLCVFIISLN